jgi:hypothetical protein
MWIRPWNDFFEKHRAGLLGCMTQCRGDPVVRWHGGIPRPRGRSGDLQRVRTTEGDGEGRVEQGRK